MHATVAAYAYAMRACRDGVALESDRRGGKRRGSGASFVGYSRVMSSEELLADEIDAPGPGGGQLLLALIALFVIVLAIVGLVAIGGWVTLVIAVLMMLAGVFGVTRYVQTIALTSEAERS
jgi:Flp pilus assembly protein TadB